MSNSIRPYQTGKSYYSSEGNRALDTRRDKDTVKVPVIGLFDIDYSVYYHLNDNWKPKVKANSNIIQVPVMFANGEKWSQIRQFGFLRDKDRKIQTPLITIRRVDMSSDDRIQLPVTQAGTYQFQSTYRIIPYTSLGMQYDRIAGQNQTKNSYEFYVLDFPNYVRVTYELIIWTDLQEQMNTLVQGLVPMSGHMWGDYYQFRTVMSTPSFDNVNIPGENRLIKTTVTLTVDGFLRNEYEYNLQTIQKATSVKRVDFLSEGDASVLQTNQIEVRPDPNNNLDDFRNIRKQVRI